MPISWPVTALLLLCVQLKTASSRYKIYTHILYALPIYQASFQLHICLGFVPGQVEYQASLHNNMFRAECTFN